VDRKEIGREERGESEQVKAKVGGKEKIGFGRDFREKRTEEVMAAGDAVKTGAVGKVGRTRQEDRQRNLVTENKEEGKR